MRPISKLFLFGAIALAVPALTAGAAPAQQLEVHAEEQSSVTECGDDSVTLVDHTVEGGCHIEFESTHGGVQMHIYIPAKVTLFNCEWHLEGQINEQGEGYIDEAVLSLPDSGPFTCSRTPCDENEDGPFDTMLPWRFHIREAGPGGEVMELTSCLRTIASGEGVAGTLCEVHIELTNLGEHNFELGHEDDFDGMPAETLCENSPPNSEMHHPGLGFITSIEPHLLTTGTDQLEIIH